MKQPFPKTEGSIPTFSSDAVEMPVVRDEVGLLGCQDHDVLEVSPGEVRTRVREGIMILMRCKVGGDNLCQSVS